MPELDFLRSLEHDFITGRISSDLRDALETSYRAHETHRVAVQTLTDALDQLQRADAGVQRIKEQERRAKDTALLDAAQAVLALIEKGELIPLEEDDPAVTKACADLAAAVKALE